VRALCEVGEMKMMWVHCVMVGGEGDVRALCEGVDEGNVRALCKGVEMKEMCEHCVKAGS